MTTLTLLNNFSPYPSTPGAETSSPGTPMSGISTVAIKDGHEGIRHGHHHERDPAAQERMARLGAYGGISSAAGSVGGDEGDYFERVAGWSDHEAGTAGEPPEEQRGLSGGELAGECSACSSGRSGPSSDYPEDDFNTPSSAGTPLAKPSLTQKLADKLIPKASLPMAPRRSPSSFSTHVPNPPCPTPATPFSMARYPLSQVASTHPGPNNNSNNNTKSSSNSSTPASGNGLFTPYTAPSPASTITTNSVREAKHHAKMLGPMTYDEGIVDTTSRDGIETTRSPSPPIVLNQRYILEEDRMDLDEKGEESRKERLEGIEERIVGGEHGAFRD